MGLAVLLLVVMTVSAQNGLDEAPSLLGDNDGGSDAVVPRESSTEAKTRAPR